MKCHISKQWEFWGNYKCIKSCYIIWPWSFTAYSVVSCILQYGLTITSSIDVHYITTTTSWTHHVVLFQNINKTITQWELHSVQSVTNNGSFCNVFFFFCTMFSVYDCIYSIIYMFFVHFPYLGSVLWPNELRLQFKQAWL